jgi:hypothetical protein
MSFTAVDGSTKSDTWRAASMDTHDCPPPPLILGATSFRERSADRVEARTRRLATASSATPPAAAKVPRRRDCLCITIRTRD